jgi:hypothetical protein
MLASPCVWLQFAREQRVTISTESATPDNNEVSLTADNPNRAETKGKQPKTKTRPVAHRRHKAAATYGTLLGLSVVRAAPENKRHCKEHKTAVA